MNVVPVVMHYYVVIRIERVVPVGSERLLVGFDETVIATKIFHGLPDCIAIRGAGLLDRHREQMHSVIGVGGAHRRKDIRRSLDLRIFLSELGDDLLADWALVAEEAVGLDKLRIASRRPRQFRETAAGNSPVRHDRHLPTLSLI